MKFAEFVAGLLPNFDKSRVIEDIRLRRTELKESTVPVYEAAAPFLSKWTIKSAKVKELEVTFQRITRSRDNMFNHINKALPNVLKNLDEVEALVEKTYSEDVAAPGLSYLKANLLQFVVCTGFVARYARKLISYVYIYETGEFEDGGTNVNDSLTPAERQYIETNFANFCMALQAISGNPANVKHVLNDVPDIIVKADNEMSLGKTMGEDKLDPMGMRFVTGVWSPIYQVRMFIAGYQNARHKEAREELGLLQLRKLNLEQTQAGKPDAAVQKKIDGLERRIQDQVVVIKRMETDDA
jgi:hypothetical protein